MWGVDVDAPLVTVTRTPTITSGAQPVERHSTQSRRRRRRARSINNNTHDVRLDVTEAPAPDVATSDVERGRNIAEYQTRWNDVTAVSCSWS